MTVILNGQNVQVARLGEVYVTKLALVANDGAGLFFTAWAAPFDAIVERVALNVTTKTTGACTVDVGSTTVSAVTASANLVDGADIGTATILATTDTVALDGSQDCQYVPSGKWVTGSMASGATAGVVGFIYICYFAV